VASMASSSASGAASPVVLTAPFEPPAGPQIAAAACSADGLPDSEALRCDKVSGFQTNVMAYYQPQDSCGLTLALQVHTPIYDAMAQQVLNRMIP